MKKLLIPFIGVLAIAAFAFQTSAVDSNSENEFLVGGPEITTANIENYKSSNLGQALELEVEVE